MVLSFSIAIELTKTLSAAHLNLGENNQRPIPDSFLEALVEVDKYSHKAADFG